jgi:hypothetical protein
MSRTFGPIRQNGYVVRDIQAALAHWIDRLGVGPWFLLERPPITDFRYRGVPSDVDVAIALANSGPLQIELIEQRNDAPSLYRDFLDAGSEGLQHVAFWTESFDADFARCEARGYTVGHAGCAGGPDGRFVYFDTGSRHPGTVVELSEVSGPKGAFFAAVRAAAESWDGRDPIRRIG